VTSASDPDEIRREIERTQANLSFDVDALAEKVTPSKIVERRVGRARSAASRWKDKVMGSNPLSGGGNFSGALPSIDSPLLVMTDSDPPRVARSDHPQRDPRHSEWRLSPAPGSESWDFLGPDPSGDR
jgi:hypothetical protein